jgi:hypothetical protein
MAGKAKIDRKKNERNKISRYEIGRYENWSMRILVEQFIIRKENCFYQI